MRTEIKDTIPLWLASAITVCVSLPFGLWLGKYNLPIWVAFIVWAEYFTLGAKPAALKIIVPAYLLGVCAATVILTGYVLTARTLGDVRLFVANDIAQVGVFFVGFCIVIYAMRFVPITKVGMLPFFNGISMMLGVYFTHSFIAVADVTFDAGVYATALEIPALAAAGAALAGLLGAFLGWFNVAIMRPRTVTVDDPKQVAGV